MWCCLHNPRFSGFHMILKRDGYTQIDRHTMMAYTALAVLCGKNCVNVKNIFNSDMLHLFVFQHHFGACYNCCIQQFLVFHEIIFVRF